MTKVPPSRVPGAPPRPSRPQQATRARGSPARRGSKTLQEDPHEVVDWMGQVEPERTAEELLRDHQEDAAEAFQQDSAGDRHADLEEKRDADRAHAQEEAKKEAKEGSLRGGGTKQQDALSVLVKSLAPPKASDGFESKLAKDPLTSAAANMEKLAPTPAPAPPPKGGSLGTVIAALNNAQEPGVYYRAYEREAADPQTDEDRELAAAVLEAQRLLADVRGIERIGPGQNEAHEPVVLIVVVRGFSQPSMELVPPQIHRFATLLAIPYDLLPLRRQ